MQREACFQGVRTALRSASLGGKSDFGATFPWGSLSMGELSLYNTGMVRQTWVWEFDITILHRKGNVRSKTFSCFVPCAPIPEDSIPGVPTYPYPPPACLKADSNYDATIHPKDTNIQWVVGSCRSQICHVLRLRFRIFEVFSDDKNNFLI